MSSPCRAHANGATGASAHQLPKRRCCGICSNCCSIRRTSTASSRNCFCIPPARSPRSFARAGFEIFRRLFLVQPLQGRLEPAACGSARQSGAAPWREADLAPAARLICEAYRDHPDSLINDQYRSVHGSMRFLNNIVRYAGCGTFSPQASLCGGGARQPRTGGAGAGLARQRAERTPDPGLRSPRLPPPRTGSHAALAVAAFSFMRLGATEISLTVTEANAEAIELYKDEGYTCAHSFDAAVWQSTRTPEAKAPTHLFLVALVRGSR